MAHLVAPSILSADFGQLDRDFAMINNSQADWFHVDIMDGLFVPNISFGFPVLKALQKVAQKPLDVHVMMVDPDRYIKAFVEAGAAILTVHAEACTHLHRSIGAVKEAGAKAGVAINPHTPVAVLENVIQDLDLVCVMSVNPGFGGQKFIPHTYKKVQALKALIQASGSKALIEVDGGVTLENAGSLIAAGADVLVAGNTVFGAADPVQAIRDLKSVQAQNISV